MRKQETLKRRRRRSREQYIIAIVGMTPIEIAILAVPLLLHLVGIYILCRTPSNETSLVFTYKLFLINLSIAEVLICMFGILKRCSISADNTPNPKNLTMIENINISTTTTATATSIIMTVSSSLRYHSTLAQYAIGYTMYYTVMTLLTLDRFFRVYFNLKFHLYWPEEWNGRILMACWALACSLLAFFATFRVSVSSLNRYMFPVYDTVFLVISVITYTYIFVKIKTNRKRLHKHRPSRSVVEDGNSVLTTSSSSSFATMMVITSDYPVVKKNMFKTKKHLVLSNSKEFLSIFLLVISFQVFTVFPDFIYVYLEHKYEESMLSEGMSVFVLFMYGMGYTVDFFIYTFSSKAVRKTLLKMTCYDWPLDQL